MLSSVRTTVTLDADTESLLRRSMEKQGISFKQALNDAIRAGVGAPARIRSTPATRPRSMGRPLVDLDKALQIAGDLEDAELTRKMQTGK